MSSLYSKIKDLEKDAEMIHTIRDLAKTEGGRLTEFGQNLIYTCAESDVKQADIARILDISPSAVNQHVTKYKK
ncbi:MAG TPA: hypothetical protein DCS48_00425 [Desulfovibrio sp.]|nr:hypothetical protein [Desulfovibrio sp.]